MSHRSPGASPLEVSAAPVAVVVALSGELRLICRLLGDTRVERSLDLPCRRGRLGPQEVVVVQSGPGPEAARHATETLLSKIRPRVIIATGYAGGLHPELDTGDLVIASSIHAGAANPELAIATELLELAGEAAREVMSDDAVHLGPLASVEQPLLSPPAKDEHHRLSEALGVDMESAGAWQAARDRDCPIICVRAILDDARTTLPAAVLDLTDSRGRLRPARLVRHLLRDPSLLSHLLELDRARRRAECSLACFLPELIRRLPSPPGPPDP